jgi:hypothetical protein
MALRSPAANVKPRWRAILVLVAVGIAAGLLIFDFSSTPVGGHVPRAADGDGGNTADRRGGGDGDVDALQKNKGQLEPAPHNGAPGAKANGMSAEAEAELRELQEAIERAKKELVAQEAAAETLSKAAAEALRAAARDDARRRSAEAKAQEAASKLSVVAPEAAAALRMSGAKAAMQAARVAAEAAKQAVNRAHAQGVVAAEAKEAAAAGAAGVRVPPPQLVGGGEQRPADDEGSLESRKYLGSEAQKEEASKQAFAFNEYRSSQLSLHRDIPDTRVPRCRNLDYPTDLPPTTVIICFVNEVRIGALVGTESGVVLRFLPLGKPLYPLPLCSPHSRFFLLLLTPVVVGPDAHAVVGAGPKPSRPSQGRRLPLGSHANTRRNVRLLLSLICASTSIKFPKVVLMDDASDAEWLQSRLDEEMKRLPAKVGF